MSREIWRSTALFEFPRALLEDKEAAWEETTRRAFRNSEMGKIGDLGKEELRDMLMKKVESLSTNDLLSVLVYIAGEHGLMIAKKRRKEKNA